MAIPTLEELFTPLTTDEVVESSLKAASDVGLPVTAWQPISVAREIIYINANNVSTFSQTTSAAAAAGLLDYATGDWLTITADQVFDVQRIESSSASGPVRLVNSSAVPYNFAPGDVRIQNVSADNATYTSTTGGVVGPGASIELEFLADQPGTASNLTSTDVLEMVTVFAGVTPEWVQNLVGQDEETDEELRERCRLSLARATPNAVKDAYDYYARTTTRPDGSTVGVTRSRTVQTDAHVDLYIADADGEIISTDVEYVQERIDYYVVPTGITATVYSADLLSITVDCTITKDVDSTASNTELTANIESALIEYFSSIDVGGDDAASFQGIYVSTLVQIIRNVGGDDVVNVVISSPAADVPLAPNQVPALDAFNPVYN